jgi:predicted nucleic acid-binding protein
MPTTSMRAKSVSSPASVSASSCETRPRWFSTQVLQEFYVVATKKLGVDAADARRKVELLARLDVVRIDETLILEAIDLHRLHAPSFRDALVVKAASRSGCARILTEDLQHGRTIDGVRIENPFARG